MAKMPKVERGIPVPKKLHDGSSGRKAKYPWERLGVGESFLVEGGKRASVRSNAARWERKLSIARGAPVKFTVMPVEGGVRVWRTE